MPYKDKNKEKEHKREYYLKNREKILEKQKKYALENKEHIVEYQKEYRNGKYWKATKQIETYDRMDIAAGRGKGNLTPQWMVDNIYTSCCPYCGETDWHKLGCNRLDNSKPHTIDNVEPCCTKHNVELWGEEQSIPTDQIDKVTGEVVRSWKSSREAQKIGGFNNSHIIDCCNGGFFDKKKNKWINITQHKDYIWKRPL